MATKRNPRKPASPTRTRTSGDDKQFLLAGQPFHSKKMSFRMNKLENEFRRADLQLHGLDHAGVSYEGRVFLNNKKANALTPTTKSEGYAGSFHVFGHGTCFGDVGHCDISSSRRTRDLRSGHPLTRAFKRLPITDALRRAAKGNATITVAIVPIIRGGDNGCDLVNVVRFDQLKIVTYD